MKINYFSDVHLEFGALSAPENDADIVVAAGDIGINRQGIDWLKTLNKPVIYVAGNHEFYNGEYSEVLNMLRMECAGSRVHFLENNTFVFRDVRFLGCTLWTDIFIDGIETAEALQKTLNDFRKISYGKQGFDIDSFGKLHERSKQWLQSELEKPFDGKTVIVTHHAPTQWSWNDSPYVLKKFAYCNDLKSLLHEFEVAAWFHGHIHSLSDYRIAGARILCNPRGYMGRKTVDGFDVNKTVVI
ncbi:MAG: metallophosphoesterase family protein [Methylomicrobium sp.]